MFNNLKELKYQQFNTHPNPHPQPPPTNLFFNALIHSASESMR